MSVRVSLGLVKIYFIQKLILKQNKVIHTNLSNKIKDEITEATQVTGHFFTSSHILIKVIKYDRHVKKKGLVNDIGEIILKLDFHEINQTSDWNYAVATNSKGSYLFKGSHIIFKLSGYGISDWFGDWGEIYSFNNFSNRQYSGAVNITGDVIVPCKFDYITYYGDYIIGVSNVNNDNINFRGYYDISGTKYFN